MNMMNLEEQQAKLAFVKEATAFFAVNPRCTSYTHGAIKPGVFFALRFGRDNDCVVVFRIDVDYPVENYQNIIN